MMFKYIKYKNLNLLNILYKIEKFNLQEEIFDLIVMWQ